MNVQQSTLPRINQKPRHRLKNVWFGFKALPDRVKIGVVVTSAIILGILGYAAITPSSQLKLIKKTQEDFISIAASELNARPTANLLSSNDFFDPELKSALELLKKIPCSIEGSTNWNQYISKTIEKIYPHQSVFFCFGANAEVSVDYVERKLDGLEVLVPDSSIDRIVWLCTGKPFLSVAASLVHEATHLAVMPSQEGLSPEQSSEITAYAITILFLKDYENYRDSLPSAEREKLPSGSEFETHILKKTIPRIMNNTYLDRAYWYTRYER